MSNSLTPSSKSFFFFKKKAHKYKVSFPWYFCFQQVSHTQKTQAVVPLLGTIYDCGFILIRAMSMSNEYIQQQDCLCGIVMKEHFTLLNSVTQRWVFNSFWTTVELCGTKKKIFSSFWIHKFMYPKLFWYFNGIFFWQNNVLKLCYETKKWGRPTSSEVLTSKRFELFKSLKWLSNQISLRFSRWLYPILAFWQAPHTSGYTWSITDNILMKWSTYNNTIFDYQNLARNSQWGAGGPPDYTDSRKTYF